MREPAVSEKVRRLAEQRRNLKSLLREATKLTGPQSERDRLAKVSREKYAAAAEIGDVPLVQDWSRRRSCQRNLLLFLITYFPATTGSGPFCSEQESAIKRIELCVLQGGRFLNTFPRGFAKSTISEGAAIWATLYGHRHYVPIFAAERSLAAESIDSIKTELTDNDLLFADFPEVCFPCRALEGKPQRCHSQTHHGHLTHIQWQSDRVIFPWLQREGEDAQHSDWGASPESVIAVCPLMGSGLGLRHKRHVDGVQQRPDLVILDDPQTIDSAASPDQVAKRLRVLRIKILRMGSHRDELSAVINATPLDEGDLTHQLWDDSSWQSMRVKMVKQWPTAHESFWLTEYADLRTQYDPNDPADQQRARQAATELYRSRRSQVDTGAVVTWEECFNPATELSAIQHAYNVLIDDGAETFESQCQCEPKSRYGGEEDLTFEQVVKKTNGYVRGLIPLRCQYLTAFIDVHEKLLCWCLCAWEENFTGYIIDYGAWPQQRRSHFTVRNCLPTLRQKYRGMGLEGSIRAGLTDLEKLLLDRTWLSESKQDMRIHRCLVDANWGDSTDTVYDFCRESKHPTILMPSPGKFVGPASTPFAEYRPEAGALKGFHWRIPSNRGKRSIRYLLIDTNFYKSFVASRFKTALGDKGSLSLFKAESGVHRQFAEQVTAEVVDQQKSERTGRVVPVYTQRPDRPDNHYLDCLVGCAVGASMFGCRLGGLKVEKKTKRTLAQRRAEKHRAA